MSDTFTDLAGRIVLGPGTLNGPAGNVNSVFGRTGSVVAGNADYLAVATGGLTGAVSATRYVGGTATGAPVAGTFAIGDYVVTQDAHIFVCTVAGTPGTWVDAGSAGSPVTSVFTRSGAVVATSGDYTAAQVTNAADKASASAQTFTGVVRPAAALATTDAPRINQLSPLFTITSGALPTATLSSGTGAQISTTRDAETSTPITTDATNNAATCAVALSPDNVTYSTLYTLSFAAAVNLVGAIVTPISLRVPAAWYLKLTVAHATIGTTTYY